MRRRFFYLPLLLTALAGGLVTLRVLGSAGGSAPPPAAATGAIDYARQCAPCHGHQGQGSADAPSFRDRPLLTEAFVARTMHTPPHAVSADTLSDPTLARIVAYLQANIVGQDLAPPGTARLEQGYDLYHAYCLECHGIFGQGQYGLGPAINVYPPHSLAFIESAVVQSHPSAPLAQANADERRWLAYYVQSLAE